jgi:hypothetical protein
MLALLPTYIVNDPTQPKSTKSYINTEKNTEKERRATAN